MSSYPSINKAAPGVPYYTPVQDPPAGSLIEDADDAGPAEAAALPTLFSPLRIRGVSLANRFAVSPMCMYSADDGHLTDFHLVHLGQFALRGVGLTMIEATAVAPEGRISPEDSGLWADSHVAPLRRITDFVRSQGHKAGIQLAHAGRKASTMAPWSVQASGEGSKRLAPIDVGGWPDEVKGPSAVAFADGYASPHEMTTGEIEAVVGQFAVAAKRAISAGFDIIEIHGAHGYLITSFLSPLSNLRTDTYGGSFENRARLLLDVVRAVRAVMPADVPLFVRVSATEWMGHASSRPLSSWDLESTLRLARLLPALGVDLLDVSSGGNSHRQRIDPQPTYQTDLACRLRAALRIDPDPVISKLLVSAVGRITEAETARDLVENGGADLVMAGRHFLSDPNWVLNVAHELRVPVKWPKQYQRVMRYEKLI